MLPTQNRRSSFSSLTTSSQAKRQLPGASENAAKANAVAPHLAKKRAPLSNVTNQRNVPHVASKGTAPSFTLVPSSSKVTKTKKVSSNCTSNSAITEKIIPQSLNAKSSVVSSCENASNPTKEESCCRASSVAASCSVDISPSRSDGESTSVDETMSSCDSFKSPEVEYLDNNDVSAMASIDRKIFSSLCISDHSGIQGSICKRDALMENEKDDILANIDWNYMDTQLCASIACDIYKHLRASEAKKRPSTDFMEKVQKDITANMRAILVDWLVEVAEEYRLVPDTLYLTANYIDRYLSGNVMNRQRLQLLGVACMMIAAKYEEICAPQVEEFCYITDNTYFKEEVLEMESAVLNYLKFEMTAPTIKCFLRRFVRAAQGVNEAPSMQLECMANYIAELSLLEYSMLCYAPSLLAASAIFLAKYILCPSKKPWNSTLKHYTLYDTADLHDCVKDLHRLCCESHNSSLSAIREKYSQHKYKCVAVKNCSPSIPSEYFRNYS